MKESTAVATREDKPDPFRRIISEALRKGGQALPRHLTPERVLTVMMVEGGRNPKLRQCTPSSLALCTMHAAQLGLEPGGPLGHFYLIPRRNKGQMECTAIVGYKGLAELCRRSGQVRRMDARVVYAGDSFSYRFGLDPDLKHTPNPDAIRTDDKVTHAYAVVVTKDGGRYFEVLDRQGIEARHDRSGTKGKSFSPWKSDFPAMARKSALRALLNGGLVPMSGEMVAAVAFDGAQERETIGEIIEPPQLTGDGLAAFNLATGRDDGPEWDHEDTGPPVEGGGA